MSHKKNKYWISAGAINLLTAIIHTVGGQLDLVNPLMNSDLNVQTKAEWIAVWHMITIVLFATSYVLLKNGISIKQHIQTEGIKLISYLYILFSIPFIVISFIYNIIAPQWILLLPIGILALLGTKQNKKMLQ